MKDPRPSYSFTEGCVIKEEVSYGRELSHFSTFSTHPTFAKIRHYFGRSATYRPANPSNGIPRGATGRQNARVSSGGEQRVTRGSILYRGRGPPLVTAMFSPMHDRCHSRRMAVATTPKPSGDTPGTSWGPYRAPPRTLISWRAYESRFPADNSRPRGGPP